MIAFHNNVNTGLQYSNDYGQTWFHSNITNGVFRDLFMNESNALVYSSGGENYYSNNSGETWSHCVDASMNLFNGVILGTYIDGSNACVGYLNGRNVFYSSDSCYSWNQATGIDNTVIKSCYMVGSNAICAGQYGMWYSSDYGHTWTKSDTGIYNIYSFVFNLFMSGSNALCGGNEGMWYSSDYGHSWSKSTIIGTAPSYFSNSCMIGSNAVVGSENGMWYSSDYGHTWNKSTIIGEPTTVFCEKATMNDSIAIAITHSGVFYSNDYGHTWSKSTVIGDLTRNFNSVDVMISGSHVVVDDYNTSGIYIASLSSPPPCFLYDSKILTDKGYIPIQNLRKGDLVKTLKDDFKPIDIIGKRDIVHTAIPVRLKEQLYRCTKEQYSELTEDLIITGCHSILVDNFDSDKQRERVVQVNGDAYVTDGKYRLPACVDDRTRIYEKPGNYTIYHLALENEHYTGNYGIYANGLLVETCSKRYMKEFSGMEIIE